jgi:hypothetical protein
MNGCVDALLIYGIPKSNTVYSVKWAFLGLQRVNENSVLTLSSQLFKHGKRFLLALSLYYIAISFYFYMFYFKTD